MQTWALIKDSFREAIDRKLFWVMLAISILIALGMACFGFDEKGISVLFGTWQWESPDLSVGSPIRDAALAGVLTHVLADMFLGWIGLGLALISTAGMFPSLMEKGTVDVLLSKPLRRWHLFLGKYAGGMIFILLQSAVFVTLTFLVAGVRWKLWLWPYFWAIPLFLVLFSYLYCFTVLFGILTRNGLTSLLLTLVAWFVIWAPQAAYESFQQVPELQAYDSWYRAVSTTRAVLPKTREIPFIAGKLLRADSPSRWVDTEDPDLTETERGMIRDAREAEDVLGDVGIPWSIGSSLAFEAVIVLLAGWRFCRRDF
jgi:ABC-type transport system involved in multi-copper enzyme maturation permease subunit